MNHLHLYPHPHPIPVAIIPTGTGTGGTAIAIPIVVLYPDLQVLIVREYFERHHKEPTVSLENSGVGLMTVGPMLLEELFTTSNEDAETRRALHDFLTSQNTVSERIMALKKLSVAGGVKGLAAKNELAQLENQDTTALNQLKVKLEAAQRNIKKSKLKNLQSSQQRNKEFVENEMVQSRKRLAERAARFQ